MDIDYRHGVTRLPARDPFGGDPKEIAFLAQFLPELETNIIKSGLFASLMILGVGVTKELCKKKWPARATFQSI